MGKLKVSKAEEKRVKGMGFLRNKGTDNFSGRVLTKNGKVTADEQIAIGEAAKKFGNGNVVYTTRLSAEVQGIPFENIEPFIEFMNNAGMQVGGTGDKVRPVVSCKGTTCQYGLYDTYALSEKIHHAFFEGYGNVKLPHKFKIAVGGCPNNCMKPSLNDVGIIGYVIPKYDKELCKNCKKCTVVNVCPMKAAEMVDGEIQIDEEKCINCGRCVRNCPFQAMPESTFGYQIVVGGTWGKSYTIGKPLGKIFTSEEEVMKTIEKAILFFRENGQPKERFAKLIERVGFEKAEAEILSDDILARKEQILAEKE